MLADPIGRPIWPRLSVQSSWKNLRKDAKCLLDHVPHIRLLCVVGPRGRHGTNFAEREEKQAHMFDGARQPKPNIYVMAPGAEDRGEARQLRITDTNDARVEVGCKLGHDHRPEPTYYHTGRGISFSLNVADNFWCGKDTGKIGWQRLGSIKLMVRFCVIQQALQTHPQTALAHVVRER